MPVCFLCSLRVNLPGYFAIYDLVARSNLCEHTIKTAVYAPKIHFYMFDIGLYTLSIKTALKRKIKRFT